MWLLNFQPPRAHQRISIYSPDHTTISHLPEPPRTHLITRPPPTHQITQSFRTHQIILLSRSHNHLALTRSYSSPDHTTTTYSPEPPRTDKIPQAPLTHQIPQPPRTDQIPQAPVTHQIVLLRDVDEHGVALLVGAQLDVDGGHAGELDGAQVGAHGGEHLQRAVGGQVQLHVARRLLAAPLLGVHHCKHTHSSPRLF